MTATATPSTLRAEIKRRTQVAHDELEALPFSRAIVDETITRAVYVRLLEQSLPVHRLLEQELARHERLGSVYQPRMARSHLLESDLGALGGDLQAEVEAPARALLSLIEELSSSHPEGLLGVLYVFEGSRLGSSILYMHLGRALGLEYLPGQGLDYHLEGVATLGPDIKRFLDALEAYPADLAERERIIVGAERTFAGLLAFYRTLA